jgi:hypothetical protein
MSTKFVFLAVVEDKDYAAANDIQSAFVLKRRMHSDLMRAIENTLAVQPFASPLQTPTNFVDT